MTFLITQQPGTKLRNKEKVYYTHYYYITLLMVLWCVGVNTVEQVVVGYAQTEHTVSFFHHQESAELVISRERGGRVYSSEKSVNELLREVIVCGISYHTSYFANISAEKGLIT